MRTVGDDYGRDRMAKVAESIARSIRWQNEDNRCGMRGIFMTEEDEAERIQ